MATSDDTYPPEWSARGLVNCYLDAFYVGDFGTVEPFLADGFSFQGPFIEATGRGSFLSSAEGLRRIVRGHRLLRQWEDGSEVSSVYEVGVETPAGAGVVTMSEWHVARDHKLVSGFVLFDTAAFRALVPST
jgi:hypothetical protein